MLAKGNLSCTEFLLFPQICELLKNRFFSTLQDLWIHGVHQLSVCLQLKLLCRVVSEVDKRESRPQDQKGDVQLRHPHFLGEGFIV